MLIRETIEERELRELSPYAAKSRFTRGRLKPEEECPIRTAYQRDRDRIVHSKAFRRLKHKTQVFIAPEGDHYRTRLTHTLEVAQIARTIARALFLNEDLTEAIAFGHDLGHTPFGHAGEEQLDKLLPGGFKHNAQSLRVVDVLEKGEGLNLTWEVREGILKHTWSEEPPSTLEGQVVRLADRIAYINHDIDDAIRAGVLKEEDLPKDCIKILGSRHRDRINTMVTDVIKSSLNKPKIIMSPEVEWAMLELRSFMFKTVYIGSEPKKEEKKAKLLIKMLYEHYLENVYQLPGEFQNIVKNEGPERAVADYIAGMTDRYALKIYKELFIPHPLI
ncbi:deoxyguanosinetriphosphate triphosphohydrolase [Carboxydothermus islandicus]|uniref:Deoxyguanosinetriphosphate triphosphohydrolase-like protein n=1 Tax=Carboxydothermus islandicus TaxID=661089 RepID=A0A1L8D324_9THEO|nr:deoxyguanosinetriphosphate triphosphohydrolase [Carboxydothermus islandicus]GAV25507.1 deoxyguanosinetriphosphate triphosphohydrolase [Carboxydothermus islandicus]